MKLSGQFLLPLFVIAAAIQSSANSIVVSPTIVSQQELPRITYPVHGTANDLLHGKAAFHTLAVSVQTHLEGILKNDNIQDIATVRDYDETLLNIALLKNNRSGAKHQIERLRQLPAKPAERMLAGVLASAYLEATSSGQGIVDHRAFRRHLSSELDRLSWPIAGPAIKELHAFWEIHTPNYLTGVVESELTPAIERNHALSGYLAAEIISLKTQQTLYLPLRKDILDILNRVISRHPSYKRNIWDDRDVRLSSRRHLFPAIVAVWDSGVDTSLFPGRLWTNPYEIVDGHDDDHDGFIDDIHGIAFRLNETKGTHLLYPLPPAMHTEYPQMKSLMKGMLDLESAIDSRESDRIQARLSRLQPNQVRPFMEELNRYGNYAHGTHVAGIALAGNPAARLMVARITFDYRLMPKAPTLILARRAAKNIAETVKYFKQNGVRVVNMSWTTSPLKYERALELNGVGRNEADRAALAFQMYKVFRDALRNAIRNAPDILFVAAAGNDDSDTQFDQSIPAGLDLPNLLSIGAVDEAGDETTFTSFGKNVTFYADGCNVRSYVPGGDRMRFSGTSMAAPQVTNLAGKLLAIDPSLSVADLISLIRLGADPAPHGHILLINPKRSIAILRGHRQN